MSHGLQRIRELEDQVSSPRLSNYFIVYRRDCERFQEFVPFAMFGGEPMELLCRVDPPHDSKSVDPSPQSLESDT